MHGAAQSSDRLQRGHDYYEDSGRQNECCSTWLIVVSEERTAVQTRVFVVVVTLLLLSYVGSCAFCGASPA